MPYSPTHHCDRCSQPPSAFAHLDADEGIFYVRMINGTQWNGEEYHMCNACMRNYIENVQILDGPEDDDEDDEQYEEEDPSPTASEEEEADDGSDDPK